MQVAVNSSRYDHPRPLTVMPAPVHNCSSRLLDGVAAHAHCLRHERLDSVRWLVDCGFHLRKPPLNFAGLKVISQSLKHRHHSVTVTSVEFTSLVAPVNAGHLDPNMRHRFQRRCSAQVRLLIVMLLISSAMPRGELHTRLSTASRLHSQHQM